MSPLEAAQAEVARLGALMSTIPFTNEVERQYNMRALIEAESLVDRLSGDANASLRARVAKLEAAASKTISVTMPEIPSWDGITDRPTDLSTIGTTRMSTFYRNNPIARAAKYAASLSPDDRRNSLAKAIGHAKASKDEAYAQALMGEIAKIKAMDAAKDAPATVSETVAAGETISDYKPDRRNQMILDGLNRGLSADHIAAMMKAADVFKAPTQDVETVEAARQSAETMPDQPFKTTILDRASIVFTKDGREAMLVEDFQRFVGNHMKQHSVDRATIQDRDETIEKLKADKNGMYREYKNAETEIATRDRLLDDQAATIGKLESNLSNAVEALRGLKS